MYFFFFFYIKKIANIYNTPDKIVIYQISLISDMRIVENNKGSHEYRFCLVNQLTIESEGSIITVQSYF